MPETFFLMTNHKGDYGCMTFTDYDMYMQALHTYQNLGWVDCLITEGPGGRMTFFSMTRRCMS